MYNTVLEFFQSYCPDVVPYLKKGGEFWSMVADNSIPDGLLWIIVKEARHTGYQNTPQLAASLALLYARHNEKLPYPLFENPQVEGGKT